MKRSSIKGQTGLRVGSQALLISALLLSSSCRSVWSSVEIERRTQTSGTYESSGWGFTILSWDLPRDAMQSARDAIADARLDNVQITESSIVPKLGYVDWLLEIIGVRFAKIRGTWGSRGSSTASSANQQSIQ